MKYVSLHGNPEISIAPKISPEDSSSKASPLTQLPPSIDAFGWKNIQKIPALGARNVSSRSAEKRVHGARKPMNTGTPQGPKLIATNVQGTRARFARWLWKRQTAKTASKLCTAGQRISTGNSQTWEDRVFVGKKTEQKGQESLLDYIKGLEEVSSQLCTLSNRAGTDGGPAVCLSDFTLLMLKLNRIVRLRDGLTVGGTPVDKGVLKCERDLLAKSASIHKQIRASMGRTRGAYEKSIFMEFTKPVEGEEFLGKGKFGEVKRIFLPAERFSSRGTLSRNMAFYAAEKTALIDRHFNIEVGAFTAFGKHPNVLKNISAHKKQRCAEFSLVSEDAGTSLQSLISRERKMKEKMTTSWEPKWSCLEPNLVKNIVSQCINGLAHIHRLNFVHGDVHPGNVLIDKHGTVRLIDFGQAFSPDALAKIQQFTTPHRLILMEKHSKEVDIFRLGYFLYTCLNFDGNMLFPNSKLQKSMTRETYEREFLSLISEQLENYKRDALIKFHPSTQQSGTTASKTQEAINGLCEMVLDCLKFSPNERPSIEDLQKRFPISK